MKQPTDTEILDWLQRQLGWRVYTGQCVFRWSGTGRGWRLHETGRDGFADVRECLVDAMRKDDGEDRRED